MGNGPGLTEVDIENAALIAAKNHGQPNFMIMPASMSFTWIWETFPEFSGTPWSNAPRVSKRERAVAKLHTFLVKAKIVDLTEEEFAEVRIKSVKRLRRAKWAQYKNLRK